MFGEQQFVPEERRIREYVDSSAGVSETVESLAVKLGVKRSQCRRVLEQLVQEGVISRRDFGDIAPIYSRFPRR
jgi:predicted ArsR family transcriptional regulator